MKLFLIAGIFNLSIFFNCWGQNNGVPPYAILLCRYIQYPSEQYKEKEAGLFFMDECRKRGLCTEVLTHEDTAFNFIASLYPLSLHKPNIIFLNHIDVVPPGDSTLWKFPPYSGTIVNDCIWGRGAIDNKGMAVAQLFAISEFVELARRSELPYNVSILSVSGEETDGHTGAKQISEQFLKKLNPYLILGEGGSGVKEIIRSNPDLIIFGVSTEEKSKIIMSLSMELPSSGHGSVPPKEYAMKEIILALEKVLNKKPTIVYNRTSVKALKTLGEHENGIQGFIQRHFTFILFRPLVKRVIKKDPILLSFFANTITFTQLNIPEGTANMISHNAEAIFDCRLLPNEKIEKFIHKINRWVKDDRIKMDIVSEVRSAPKTSNPEVFYRLKESIDSIFNNSVTVDMIFPATTDNNFFRSKGIPVFGIFPACFSEEELMSIHNINERIHFDRLETAIDVYTIFLESLITQEKINSLTKY